MRQPKQVHGVKYQQGHDNQGVAPTSVATPFSHSGLDHLQMKLLASSGLPVPL